MKKIEVEKKVVRKKKKNDAGFSENSKKSKNQDQTKTGMKKS